MLNEKNFKTIITILLIVGLFLLAGFIVYPIIIPIIYGVLLGYIFNPFFKWIKIKVKNPTLAALIVCFIIISAILIPLIFILNSLASQGIELYLVLQKVNFQNIFNEVLPSFFTNTELIAQLSSSLNNLITYFISSFLKFFSNFLLELPQFFLKLFVVIFIFFFILRDGEKLIEYIKSLSPLKKDIEKQFFQHFKDVTYSVLVGQVIIGILQGIIAGIGYFIFGVPNALILTLLTILTSIIPLIGAWIVWVPIDIYLFATGHIGAGIGLLIYGGLIISLIDNFLRPLLVSRKIKINSAIIITGMIGGLFVFGILGLILGPLILVYVILVFEIYRKSKLGENLFFEKSE